MKFEIGQRLFVVDRRGNKYEVTITKVGNKWLTCSQFPNYIETRFARDTLMEEGYCGGKAYLSREHWEAETRRMAAWATLRQVVRDCFYAPKGLTTDVIERMTDRIKGAAGD